MQTLEMKAMRVEFKADADGTIEGYASRFGEIDRGNDEIAPGAYAGSLASLAKSGRKVKMLWQHDPAQPIGVWDEVKEDATGLWVKGRILESVSKGREAAELVRAGAIDGFSIGYRTVNAERGEKGQRILRELDLWEVSLVTFPMQESARASSIKAGAAFDDGHSALLKRLIETDLREAGFSVTKAKAAAAAAAGKLEAMRDAGEGLEQLREALAERAKF